jgi:cyclic pyranopterin phosphate synthase
MVEVYTDGAFNPALDQGGWGAVIIKDGQKQVFSGADRKTTSNRMEITAALEGIGQTPQDSEVVVYTDSQYLFGCMTKGWQRRANRDLWEKLDVTVIRRRVRWHWIERNDTNPFHQEAHNLATNLARQSENLPPVSFQEQKPQQRAPYMDELTHMDPLGRPRMVDVTEKADTQREAVARCLVRMKASTFDMLTKGNMPKGDVLAVAQLAGIMAAKQTPNLIPLCHTLLIGSTRVEFSLDKKESIVEITATVKSMGKTGVEMEALTATVVTALTVYDMCKAVDRGIQIESIRLIRKSGGKSGTVDLEEN